jgi:hypothetical protein
MVELNKNLIKENLDSKDNETFFLITCNLLANILGITSTLIKSTSQG